MFRTELPPSIFVGRVLCPLRKPALVGLEGLAEEVDEVPADGKKKDDIVGELRRRVALGLRKKLDDDLASMFNVIGEGDVEAVKLMLDKGFSPNTQVLGRSAFLSLVVYVGSSRSQTIVTWRKYAA